MPKNLATMERIEITFADGGKITLEGPALRAFKERIAHTNTDMQEKFQNGILGGLSNLNGYAESK